MVRFCGLSATLGAFRLGALPAIVRRSSSGQSGGGRGIGGSSFLAFPFRGFPLGAKRKGSVVGGTQRAFSSRRTGAGSPGFAEPRWLRGGGGWSRSFWGAAFWGPRGGAPRGAGPFGLFPFGTASFALFGPKSQVFPATFRLRFGELPATKRRRLRRPFVTKFAVSSPFAAGGFFFLITREGALAGGFCPQRPGAGAAPTSPLCRGEVRHFAVRKSPARHFAALPWRSPTKPPGFPTSPWQSSPLCSAKVHQATRFFTSPRESRWPHFAALPC